MRHGLGGSDATSRRGCEARDRTGPGGRTRRDTAKRNPAHAGFLVRLLFQGSIFLFFYLLLCYDSQCAFVIFLSARFLLFRPALI